MSYLVVLAAHRDRMTFLNRRFFADFVDEAVQKAT